MSGRGGRGDGWKEKQVHFSLCLCFKKSHGFLLIFRVIYKSTSSDKSKR